MFASSEGGRPTSDGWRPPVSLSFGTTAPDAFSGSADEERSVAPAGSGSCGAPAVANELSFLEGVMTFTVDGAADAIGEAAILGTSRENLRAWTIPLFKATATHVASGLTEIDRTAE